MKKILFGLGHLLMLIILTPDTANGQLKKNDIVKLIYSSSYGGMFSETYQVLMEIKPDGKIRMLNNHYDTTGEKKLANLMSEQDVTVTMSLDEFKTFASKSSSYLGKITNEEYGELITNIMQRQTDTTNWGQGCCCDIPYKMLKVYFRNGGMQFMACGGGRERTIALLKLLDKIAYQAGYKISPVDFKRKEFE